MWIGPSRSTNFKNAAGEEQPWFVVRGQVYDGTKFLQGHPGGATSIAGAAGQDVTEEFMAIRELPVPVGGTSQARLTSSRQTRKMQRP